MIDVSTVEVWAARRRSQTATAMREQQGSFADGYSAALDDLIAMLKREAGR